jgi:hypothetical protein
MSHPSITSGVESRDEIPDYANVASGKVIHYSRENYLKGIPTRNEIVVENDTEELTAILDNALAEYQKIPFMTIDVEETTKFING